MKNATIISILSFLLFSHAYANEGDQYLVSRLGAMSVQMNNAEPLLSAGFYLGHGFTNKLSAEAEVTLGVNGGDYHVNELNKGKYQIWTAAAYGVFRHPFGKNIYFKGKFGLLYENVSNDRTTEVVIHRDYGFSGGVGLGIRLPNEMTLETEFTMLEKDIYFGGLGIHVHY